MTEIDREIELGVLGALFVWYDDVCGRLDGLEEEDFYFFPKLFRALKEEYLAGTRRMDMALVLSRRPDPELHENAKKCLSYAVPVHALDDNLTRLRELAVSRRLSAKLQELVFGGEIRVQDLEAIVGDESGRQAASGAAAKALDNLSAYIARIGQRRERILTGFSTVDAVLGGLRKPSVCYIGARPSTGKTTLALNIAQAQRGKRTLLFSLEMDSEMIFERLACAELSLDYSLFTKQRLSETQAQAVREYMSQLREREELLVLDDVYGVEGIAAAAATVKPDLVVIDYIQKITTRQKLLTTREKIEHISGELKRIAKYNSCCILCLSQISRDGKDAPTMSSLKEAGGLEADGDYILMLHRPYVENKNNPEISPETAALLIDKNKFGNTGTVDMRFDGAHQRFFEVDHWHEDDTI